MSDKDHKHEQRKERVPSKRDGVCFPVGESLCNLPGDYPDFLTRMIDIIAGRRVTALQKVNVEQILLYWQLGQRILIKQQQAGWGAKVIDRLSQDLKKQLPALSGFSPRNLKYMTKFAASWPDAEIVQRTVAQLPWRSNCALLDKVKEQNVRLWYAQEALERGWSRDMLVFHIDNNEFGRRGKSINNFPETLPPVQSDMAVQLFKDPYLFDFIGLDTPKREAELEKRLQEHLEQFLVELGQGFAFVGRQVHLELGNQDFYADLLFYHLKMRCYVVVELKIGAFKPEHVSQLHLYQAVIDDQMRHDTDQPTIGLLLVKEKNNLVVEYALSGYNNPIGVANWQQTMTQQLPEGLQSSLPTIEELEQELSAVLEASSHDE